MEVITVFGFRNSLFCSGPDIGSLSTKSASPLIGLLPVFNLNLQSSSLLLDKFMQRKGLFTRNMDRAYSGVSNSSNINPSRVKALSGQLKLLY